MTSSELASHLVTSKPLMLDREVRIFAIFGVWVSASLRAASAVEGSAFVTSSVLAKANQFSRDRKYCPIAASRSHASRGLVSRPVSVAVNPKASCMLLSSGWSVPSE